MEQPKKETKTQNTKYYYTILLLWSKGPVLYIEFNEYIQLRYHDKSS